MSGHGSPRRHRVQPARRVAFDVISAVTHGDAYANILLPRHLDRAGLGRADAALATELTYGTLRMRGYYDRVISKAAARDIGEIDSDVLDVLRLGAHQLLATRVAPHAAVNESVALAHAIGSRSAAGFVNAVLRTITRIPGEQWRERVLKDATRADDRLAVGYSHPAWIIRALRRALDAEGRSEELERLLAADNEAPEVNLVALPGHATIPSAATRNAYSPYGFTMPDANPADLLGTDDTAIRAQDEGSQIAAMALVAARPVASGERWIDLCAAPGGKAALLTALGEPYDVRLVANELHRARVGLVLRAVETFGNRVDVRCGDARQIGTAEPERYDRILLDAPCSGLGALRRRPEARWRKAPRDIAELTRLQESLVDSAVAALRADGILAYVTCSPHPAETDQVMEALHRRHPEMIALPTAEIVNSALRAPLDLAGPGAYAQLWPHRHGTDAMFIALLRKDPSVTG